MRKYWKLTRILLKSGLGNSGSGSKRKKGIWSKLSGPLRWLVVGLCLLPMAFMLFEMGSGGYEMLSSMNQEGILVELIWFAGALMTLLFGLPYILTVFYMSNDTVNLLPMPLRPVQIVAAKFTVAWFYELLTTAALLGPILIGFGWASGASAGYWLFCLLGLLIMPVMPLMYASIISMIFMRLFKGAKNKSVLTTMGSILLIIASMGIGMLTSQMDTMDQDAMIRLLMSGHNSLVGFLSKMFPNFRFLVAAVLNVDVLSFLLFLVTVAALLVIFLFIAEKLYFSGVLGMTETISKRKAITEGEREKLIRKSGPKSAYFKKEMRLLMRTPVFFLNCALMVVLWPLFVIIPLVVIMVQDGAAVGELFQELGQMGSSLFAPGAIPDGVIALIWVFVFGFTALVGSTNMTSATAISREGKGISTMLYIPMTYRDQVRMKMLPGILFSALGSTFYLVIIFVYVVIVGFPPLAGILALVINVLTILCFNCLQIWRDLCAPKLSWETEQQAVKQNFNSVLTMLLCWGIGGGLGAGAVFLYLQVNPPLYVIGGLACGVLLLLTLLFYRLAMRAADRKLAALE